MFHSYVSIYQRVLFAWIVSSHQLQLFSGEWIWMVQNGLQPFATVKTCQTMVCAFYCYLSYLMVFRVIGWSLLVDWFASRTYRIHLSIMAHMDTLWSINHMYDICGYSGGWLSISIIKQLFWCELAGTSVLSLHSHTIWLYCKPWYPLAHTNSCSPMISILIHLHLVLHPTVT